VRLVRQRVLVCPGCSVRREALAVLVAAGRQV
jgi:hypothetical protein